MNQALA